MNLLIVRELTGDVYFGEKGERRTDDGDREGWDTMSYSDAEVKRIAAAALEAASARSGRLTSVDKANVLETSRIWRETMDAAATSTGTAVEHMYVDNAAMQLVANPGQFDTIVTGNLFGDILSDLASACVGSIGLMPSASLGSRRTEFGTFGLYEPVHGSAPDIAGQGSANPLAMILSLAMMLRHSFANNELAERVERAVEQCLRDGVHGSDLGGTATTSQLGDAVLSRL